MTLRNREERRVVRRAFRTGTVDIHRSCSGTGPMSGKEKNTYKIGTCMKHGNAAAVLAAHRRLLETGNDNSYVTSASIVEAGNDIVEFLSVEGVNLQVRTYSIDKLYEHMVEMEKDWYMYSM